MATLLSGCGTVAERSMSGDGTKGTIAPTLNTIVQATVLNDEVSSSFALSNFDRGAGVGDAERVFRRVPILMILAADGKPPLFLRKHAARRATLALVPDGMPLLRRGDIVHVRTRDLWDGLKDFSKTGEGTAIVSLKCQGGSKPGKEEQILFKKCAERLPWLEEWGEELRFYEGILAVLPPVPYRDSLRDWKELSFTPFYDRDGSLLPNRVLPAERTGP